MYVIIIANHNSLIASQIWKCSPDYGMAKTTEWLNAILDYMRKVKSPISMVFGLVF